MGTLGWRHAIHSIGAQTLRAGDPPPGVRPATHSRSLRAHRTPRAPHRGARGATSVIKETAKILVNEGVIEVQGVSKEVLIAGINAVPV